MSELTPEVQQAFDTAVAENRCLTYLSRQPHSLETTAQQCYAMERLAAVHRVLRAHDPQLVREAGRVSSEFTKVDLTPSMEQAMRDRLAACDPHPLGLLYEECGACADCGDGHLASIIVGADEVTDIADLPDAEWTLMVHARPDLDAALAEIDRLRAELAEVRADATAKLQEAAGKAHAARVERDRLREELAARPPAAHVWRQAAHVTEEMVEQYEDFDAMKAAGIIGPHTMAAAISSELNRKANEAEHAAALRPWKAAAAERGEDR